jgi:hypothetical protein
VKNQNVTAANALRIEIATSVAAGQSITATARQLGISREWASRIANAPETQQIIASLVNTQLERLYDLFDAALTVIEQAFRARRKGISKGEVIDLGPDHYARLASVGRLVQILTAGRAMPKPKEQKQEDGLIDYDQLRRLVEGKLGKEDGGEKDC